MMINYNHRFAIGVDIGGSHISCAIVDLITGHIFKESQTERKINNKASAEEILNGWSEALQSVIGIIGKKNIAGIGFAIPGPFAYDRGIALFNSSVDKFEKLYNVNIPSELNFRLNINDDIPIRFMNDASAFAVGEAWFGKASGFSNSVSITLGTGFGSAFLKNGLPVVENVWVPKMGCVWHLPFKNSIADDYFSTRWFIAQWKNISGETVNGVREIADRAFSDVRAKDLFIEYGSNMGQFLGPWLKRFNAEILVIGGNVVSAYSLFGPSFEQKLKELNVPTKIAISNLREDAAIIGSARLIDSEYYKKIKPVLPKM